MCWERSKFPAKLSCFKSENSCFLSAVILYLNLNARIIRHIITLITFSERNKTLNLVGCVVVKLKISSASRILNGNILKKILKIKWLTQENLGGSENWKLMNDSNIMRTKWSSEKSVLLCWVFAGNNTAKVVFCWNLEVFLFLMSQRKAMYLSEP